MKEKYDKAKQLIIEAVTLYKTNAPESMRSALLKFEQARLIYQALNEQKEEAHCLGWLGSLSNSLGDKQKALDYYLQALPLYRAVDDKDGELGMLDRMSIIFHILGASRDAAVTHNKIGEVYLALGKNEQALKNYNQSLQLYRAANDNVGEANTLHNIGEVYSYLVGDREQALKFYKEALPLRYGFGDKELVADTLYNISAVYDDLGEQQLALKFYKEALPLFRVNNKTYEARTLYNLFSVLVLDNPRLGIFYGKLAVNIYQILPPWWQEHDKNVQQFFLKSIEDTYIRLADALSKQQRHAEAQQVLDFYRSEQIAPLAFTVREAELTKTLNQKLETVVAAIHALDEYERAIRKHQTIADEAQLKSFADEQTAAKNDYLAFLKIAEREFAAPLEDKDKFPDVPDLTQ